MSSPLFTIILPTTADRGLLLPYSVQSVLRQAVNSFELLIIGDGVNEHTRQVIQTLIAQDHRIRFFDYPKHLRRGEPYRHQVLMQYARGQYVAYILDRDLWLPNHLDVLLTNFQKGNFVSSNVYLMLLNQKIDIGFSNPKIAYIFSAVAHTLQLYKSLPFGWRVTPPQFFTDEYMWEQFQASQAYRPAISYDPTVLYFKRGATHPGIPTKDRVAELKRWAEYLDNPDATKDIKEKALKYILEERIASRKDLIRIKGRTWIEITSLLKIKITDSLAALKRRLNYAMKGHWPLNR